MTASLVTGAAGFIGSHVSAHCLALGHEVVALDDLSGGFIENLPRGCTFIHASVTDQAALARVFDSYDFDYVYHISAYAAEGLSHYIRNFNYTNNVIGSVNVINECVRHDVKRLVFTSSIAVYGANQLPMSEGLRPAPEDPYGISKFAVEMDLQAAAVQFGLDYTIFRPHNVYGENQNLGDRYRNVVGIFMNQIMSGEPLTIFGDGSQTRAFSHINDVAPIIAKAVHIDGSVNEVFNIGADIPCSVGDLARLVSDAFDCSLEIRYLPPRNEVHDAFASHAKLQSVFGDRARVSLPEGVARMAAWARERGPQTPSDFGSVEVWKNFPEGWGTVVKEAATPDAR